MQRIEEKMRIELRAQRLEFSASAKTLRTRGPSLFSAKTLSCLNRIDDPRDGDVDQQASEEATLK